MAREIGYLTLFSESMRYARDLRSFWLAGAFVLYLQSGYVFAALDHGPTLMERFDLSSAVLVGLLFPGIVLVLSVLHAAADAMLIVAGHARATSGSPSLGAAWVRAKRSTAGSLAIWLALSVVLVAWAGVSSGIPVILGVIVHPVIGALFGTIGFALFLVTVLFLLPLGLFALREHVLQEAPFRDAWHVALAYVRGQPARAAGVTVTGGLLLLIVSSIEVLAVVLSGIVWMALDAMLPTPLAVAGTFLLLFPVYLSVRGWLGSSLSYFWTLAYLWVRREAGTSR